MQATILVSQQKKDLPQGWINQVFKLYDNNQTNRHILSNDSKRLQSKETFCHCLNVELNEIEQAIESGKITVDSIRRKTKAGNGCGSCIGDIALKLKQY
jgi:NAD(P)H-nitrite reductase large subunit